MRRLPTGTVTFLFTDIEGSTRLLDELGAERYAELLAEHHRVCREAWAAHGGVEVDTQGDAFFVVFERAAAALAAAEAARQALARGPARVRMGLHSAEVLQGDTGYVGSEVHRAARIAASGHGGQIILSAPTRELAGEGFALSHLGEHRFKDFEEPTSLYQLGGGNFPPLKTISNTNLPRPVSSFVGRERELAELQARIEQGARLVTLTGSGGSGKTRLALEAAASAVPAYEAGVFWIDCAALRDPALVTGTIAQTLGAKDGLAEHIGHRDLLLLLDNLEQVIEVAPELSRLLQACPKLTLLVTSRELLRVQGERDFPVPPLATSEAVSLFCERAQAEPSDTIAELCARLDNLPLAVELAAARASVLSPAQILERLAQRLDLLKGGRDADPRQETLRATIEWSYDLLRAAEQEAFARLAVFESSFDVDAAEAVTGVDVDTLQSLVDKSLVRRWGSGRLGILETVREYALERLGADDSSEALHRAHAEWFLELAATAEMRGPEHARWLERLRADHSNFRAALAWLHDRCSPDELRLASDLAEYAYHSGALVEGRRWLDRAISSSASWPDDLRARGLAFAALTAAFEGDFATAAPRAEEALSLARRCSPATLGEALRALALVRGLQGDVPGSTRLDEEALEVARTHRLDVLLADVANNLGYSTLCAGELDRARPLLNESIASARARGDAIMLAVALANLALVDIVDGRLDDAAHSCGEALEICRRHGLGPASTGSVAAAGAVMARAGDYGSSALAFGVTDELARLAGEPLQQLERELRDDALREARLELGDAAVEEARAHGRTLDADEGIRVVLGCLTNDHKRAGTDSEPSGGAAARLDAAAPPRSD